MHHLTQFLIHLATMSLCLWVASQLFRGVSFSSTSALLVSALMLGLVNSYVRPVLVLLTLPLTLLTLGLFLLVINALMVQFVAYLVKGFEVSGFWTALFLSVFVTVFSFVVEWALAGASFSYSVFPAAAGHAISV
jgi:putative membrane protein